MAAGYIGRSLPRLEDEALLRGRGRFADDIHWPDTLHAVFLRSPLAHARIGGIDTGAARALPGVHAVLTHADLQPLLTMERIPTHMPGPGMRHRIDPRVLALNEVCHVGESVALVLADSRAAAEDAAETVAVDYAPLPVVADPRDAIAGDAPPVRLDVPDNTLARTTVGYGDVDSAFAGAAHVVREQFIIHKGGGHAIETRGVVARLDPVEDRLTVWDGTQMPHRAFAILAEVLGLPERRLRVVCPDVGGGFGPKFVFYPEEVAIAAAALLTRRPVKWIEDRLEHFSATTQERDQFWDVAIALDTEARILGIRGTLIHDHGAWTPYGTAVSFNSATTVIGPYVVPAYSLDVISALTNKVPVTPTRGAGRPQGTFVVERLLDLAAKAAGISRAEIRWRNLIPAEAMPYATPLKSRDGVGMTYDSGDFPACQAMVLEHIDETGFPARQRAALAEGRYIGLGHVNYIEGSGRGPFESARLRVGSSGRVSIATGATSQGQGVRTFLAQVCADGLGIRPDQVDVIAGDTDAVAIGLGAFASRQAVTAGNAVRAGALDLRAKILTAASGLLEAAEADLEIRDGAVHVAGAPGHSVTFGEIARALGGMPGYAIPGGMTPGLGADAAFAPPAIAYCNGTHAAEVEVDPETGLVTILRYVVGHDCGRQINPRMVEGQILGGVAHGVGNALLEEMHFDDQGQPLTAQLGDYLLPTAPLLPEVEILHMETPTALNPLGVKGAGEGGTIPAAACIVGAIEDALHPFGVVLTEAPVSPARLLDAIRAARS